jgi:hypothetical protein
LGEEETADGFSADAKRHDRKNERTGEAGEFANLPRSKREPRVRCMAAGVAVGERRDSQCPCMGRHVETVRKKRHRTGYPSRSDLHDHHRSGESDNVARTALMGVVCIA